MKLQPYIEQFNKMDIKMRYGAFAAAVLVFVLVDYFALLGPQLGALNKMGEQTKTLSNDIQRVKADMTRINEIKQGLEGARRQLQGLDSKIRLLSEMPAVLEEMSAMANASQVKIDQLLPSKDGPQNLVTAGDIKYYALPIVVETRSGYHMFGRFLNKLENSNLLFMVKDLRMEGSDQSTNLSIRATLEVVLADKKK